MTVFMCLSEGLFVIKLSRFLCLDPLVTDLVLLGVEDEVDQGHQVPFVRAEVGPVSAGADSVEEDQVLGSGGAETHVCQNLIKSCLFQ